MNWILKHSLYFSWMIALVAVLGSLYYGEVLNFEPCRLCWYQRIAMFPLVLFLGVAFYKVDPKLARYCLPLVALGASLALYQSLTQIFPSTQIAALCGEGTPCTIQGFAPYLSFFSFAAIGVLILKNKF